MQQWGKFALGALLLVSPISVVLAKVSLQNEKEVFDYHVENIVDNDTVDLVKKTNPKTIKAVNDIDNSDLVYAALDFGKFNKLDKHVFIKAYKGHQSLVNQGKIDAQKHILTVCDFSLSANEPRMWIIDLNKHKVLYNNLVAHGQGTGEEFSEKFSNRDNSHQSSLGFYVTQDTYVGANGYSLKLQGMDKGFNDRAYARAIVVHGADYVSESFIKQNNRLGRSWGCPALPREIAHEVIDLIKGGNSLFIYYPDQKYLASSKWLKDTDKLNPNYNPKKTYLAETATTNGETYKENSL